MGNNSVYESIMAGLNEALADAQSEKPILKRHKVIVEPVVPYVARLVLSPHGFLINIGILQCVNIGKIF